MAYRRRFGYGVSGPIIPPWGTGPRPPRIGWVRRFIGVVLALTVGLPFRLIALWGLLARRRRTAWPGRGRLGRGGDGGPGGMAGAGVGAPLPTVPPTLTGAAALAIPRDDTTPPA